jgi:hypothetical protein
MFPRCSSPPKEHREKTVDQYGTGMVVVVHGTRNSIDDGPALDEL